MSEEKKQDDMVEDLNATGKIDTTIEGVSKSDDQWVKKAAKKVNAVEGNTYVKLDRGLLTVDQLNYFLNSMPLELTYADSNNQFLYYNNMMPTEKMLASRTPEQVGEALVNCHPKRAQKHVAQAIHALRTGETDEIKMRVPTGPDKCIMHYYRAMHDKKGDYAGVNEYVLDLMPVIKWYLEKTGQKLVADPDAGSSASLQDQPDDTSSASVDDEKKENLVDDASSASVND